MLPASLRMAEVVSALSQALDLGSGLTAWHSIRTCILGMRIAAEMKLPAHVQDELYYALLLKDAGVNGYRSGITDASHSHDGRGATLARFLKLPESTVLGIAALSERWNGYGTPKGLKGEEIPIASRIILIAQTLDSFFTNPGPEAACSFITQKSGIWFDPTSVKAALSLARRSELWTGLSGSDLPRIAIQLDPSQRTTAQGNVSLEVICQAFAAIVDAKSPFTYNHSNGVANAAVAMASKLGLEDSTMLFVRYAALLHDLGKMAVSDRILQKPGKLTDAEWRLMRTHPEHTWRILHSIRGFEEISEVAAAHHERLDGSGYFRGLTALQLPLEARILAVADIFDALSASRPYRKAMPREKVLATIRKSSPHGLDAACVEALEQSVTVLDRPLSEHAALQKQLSLPLKHSVASDKDSMAVAAASAK